MGNTELVVKSFHGHYDFALAQDLYAPGILGSPPKHRTTADLIVGITSPSSGCYDRTTKADTYEAMKVREMWLVDPDKQTVEVRYFRDRTAAVFTSGDVLKSKVPPESTCL